MARDLLGRRLSAAVLGALLACMVFSATAQAAGDTGKAWGYNGNGQLGDGNSPTNSPVPVTISGLSGATQISSGVGDHALALLSDGSVVAWGSGFGGQLGDGNTDDEDTPVAVSGITNAIAVSTGNAHSLALLSDGTVVAWGRNYAGQLGRDDTGLDDCGGTGPCSKTPLPVPGLSNVVAIAAGGAHSLALLSDGTVMAWGRNSDGQLGDGDDTGPGSCGGDACSTAPIPVSPLADVVDIAAGSSHSLALLADGTLMGWGSNGYGETGSGSTETDEERPAPVPGVTDVVDIAAGYGHSLALLSNGWVLGWGDDESGEVGNGSISSSGCSCVRTPVAVAGPLTGAVAIATGGYQSMALLAGGTVKAWGANSSGQLGNNDPGTDTGSPVTVSGLTNATALGGNYASSFALVGPTQTLTISLPGTGDGKVVGSGISCPPVCSHDYPQGASVLLRGLPAPSTTFAGFGSPCSGTGTCQVTLDQDRTVSAQFGELPPGSSPPSAPPSTPAGPTGQRAAALKKCKKVRPHKKHKRCVKRAKQLPE